MTAPNRASKPSVVQYVLYCCGKRLPAQFNDWVANDLAGPGAAWRMVVRATVPCVLLVAPLLLFPAGLEVKITMTLPLILPFIYFAIALNRVYRRHRMSQHGLDPALIDALTNARAAEDVQRYREKHGHE